MVSVNFMTYADIIRPSQKVYAFLYDAFLVLAGSILIALSSRFAFYLPFSPVPVTGQTFAVLFLSALYGKTRGVLTVLAYVGEGIAGLPVFAGNATGLAYLLGPTGGYIAGFAAASFVTGWLAEKGWDRKPALSICAMLIGEVILFSMGTAWLSYFIGLKAFIAGVIPFIPGEAVKIACASALLPAGWNVLQKLR